MKTWHLLLLFVFAACSTSNKKNPAIGESPHAESQVSNDSAQTNIAFSGKWPDENMVYNDLQTIIQSDSDFVEDYKVKKLPEKAQYFLGSFTEKHKKECLVLLPPVISCPRSNCNAVLLYLKTEAGWRYEDWYALYMNDHEDEKIMKILDVDADSLLEVFFSYAITGTGIYGTGYNLISLKNLEEKMLYQNEGLDFSSARDVSTWKKGEIVSTIYQISFVEGENHHLILKENKITNLFEKLNGDSILTRRIGKNRKIRF